MFHEGLTAETLFYEPHLLERYLEILSEETSVPYITRLQQKGKSIDFSDETHEVIKLLDTKDSQIKVLINYLSLIIERSQDKMITQTETIEHQEREIERLKEENITVKEELKLFKGSLEELREKHSTLEAYLEDVEKRYQNDKVHFNEAQLEAQILKGIKENLSERKSENSRLENMNQNLRETVLDLEKKLECLREENADYKENFEALKHSLARSGQVASEYERMKSAYDKICKEYEVERHCFVSERRASEENLGLVSQRCIQLQEELLKAKSMASQRSLNRINSIEDPNQNLNAKLAPMHKFYSEPSLEGSIVLDNSNQDKNKAETSFPSTVDTLENYSAEQFDGIRINPHSDLAGIKKARQKPILSQKLNTTDARYCYSPIEENSPRVSDIGSFDDHNSGSTAQNSLKLKRKNILEEFFLLTFQSTLLNSEHFNDLAGIESSKLFEEINKQDVPYYQWSKWLEDKLENLYKDVILPRRRASRAQKKEEAAGSVIVG